ncbi:MAG: alpha/beta hydrolase [Pseudomonadota bacterium]
MNDTAPEFMDFGTGDRIAVVHQRGSTDRPGLFWLGGFKSSMDGTKATALASWAGQHKLACTRFDYSGHGVSGGSFEEGTVTGWLKEAVGVFREVSSGPQVVIGSSMGGWLALLLCRALTRAHEADRIHALVLIAPAVDMTEELMWKRFPDEVREELDTAGVYQRPSRYGDGDYAISRKLIEDGREHLLLAELLSIHCPVRILHGEADPDVPWEHGLRLYRHLDGPDISFTLIKDGDHRLSSPQEIGRLLATVSALLPG